MYIYIYTYTYIYIYVRISWNISAYDMFLGCSSKTSMNQTVLSHGQLCNAAMRWSSNRHRDTPTSDSQRNSHDLTNHQHSCGCDQSNLTFLTD